MVYSHSFQDIQRISEFSDRSARFDEIITIINGGHSNGHTRGRTHNITHTNVKGK
jgi:hypothetical protein